MNYGEAYNEELIPLGRWSKVNELSKEDLDYIKQEMMFICDVCGFETIISDKNDMTINLKDGRKIEYEVCTRCINNFHRV